MEDLIRQHEGVLEVAVIGIPDERAGEIPGAYVKTEKFSRNTSWSKLDGTFLISKIATLKCDKEASRYRRIGCKYFAIKFLLILSCYGYFY